MSMSDIDWGDAPTWIAALFAGGAAWFAGRTLGSQRKQIKEQREFIREQSENLQLERNELRAQADDRKRQQAASVEMTPRLEQTRPTADSPWNGTWIVKVVNMSPEPVHEVSVQFEDPDLVVRFYTDPDFRRGTPAVPPVEVVRGDGGSIWFQSSSTLASDMEARLPILFFTDNAGVRWRRDVHGDLAEAPPTST
ncbi:hypothetical protein AB0D99_10580 [Streptomyces sp. NPDC047971]|uniref:hypothetical protein n=1 Tax=Streptomyces sp. NPDC047971 TaxID=3154499 RepID=UPI0033FC1340